MIKSATKKGKCKCCGQKLEGQKLAEQLAKWKEQKEDSSPDKARQTVREFTELAKQAEKLVDTASKVRYVVNSVVCTRHAADGPRLPTAGEDAI